MHYSRKPFPNTLFHGAVKTRMGSICEVFVDYDPAWVALNLHKDYSLRQQLKTN